MSAIALQPSPNLEAKQAKGKNNSSLFPFQLLSPIINSGENKNG